jgi:hypothetical protein
MVSGAPTADKEAWKIVPGQHLVVRAPGVLANDCDSDSSRSHIGLTSAFTSAPRPSAVSKSDPTKTVKRRPARGRTQLLGGLLFVFGFSVTSDAGEMVPTGRRADSL